MVLSFERDVNGLFTAAKAQGGGDFIIPDVLLPQRNSLFTFAKSPLDKSVFIDNHEEAVIFRPRLSHSEERHLDAFDTFDRIEKQCFDIYLF
jgi:hypothetical protein